MAYDEEFYKQYNEYLKEVNEKHSHIISNLLSTCHPLQAGLVRKDRFVISDLGCGIAAEFEQITRKLSSRITPIDEYIKIDINGKNLFSIDYRETNALISLLNTKKCNMFVSLFSSEITASFIENYKLYKKIFESCPTIEHGLVSGFYYSDKLDQEEVQETGDITSYQTLERLCDVKCEEFSEYRLEAHVPSEMFGPNVYEVWKFFKRN